MGDVVSIVAKLQDGCTVISFIAALFGRRLSGHACCDEHDLAYEQGGTWSWKWTMDARLARCIAAKNGGGAWGWTKAVVAWSFVTFVPYSYVVWTRPEPQWDRIEREVNRG